MTSPDAPAERVAALGELWLAYAEHEFGAYSPLYAAIARHVAGDEDLLRLILESPPEAHQPNVLLAAVHYLILGGLDHPLACLYANPTSAPDPGPLFRDVCLSHRLEVLSLMTTRRTQTNECGRSALIALALARVAATVGEPIGLLDAGASAGLNLLLDRYLLDYGSFGTLGPRDSPVRIRCEVRGGDLFVPPSLPVISQRLGIDRAPVNLADPADARWLLACVWPDTGRLERTAAAVDVARLATPPVRRGDMVDDLPAALAEFDPGPVAVVTSSSYSYLSIQQREAFREVLASEGRKRPVAWISADSLGVVDVFEPRPAPVPAETSLVVLGLVLYDRGGWSARPLALAHAHGSWVCWVDAAT